MPDLSFPERLRQLREAAHLSVAELAQRAGLERTHLHALERGSKRRLTWDTVCKLADALGVSVQAFRQE